jgi:uncharacterized phage-associated protein
MTATIFDVSKYILTKQGPMTTMKLQKLAYYSYAWHLVWTDESLFSEKFRAWENGPVCYELFDIHRRMFMIADSTLPMGAIDKLERIEKESVDRVLKDYGDLSGGQLSDLTHNESPWLLTRNSHYLGSIENVEITDDLIRSFYSTLDKTGVRVADLSWPD